MLKCIKRIMLVGVLLGVGATLGVCYSNQARSILHRVVRRVNQAFSSSTTVTMTCKLLPHETSLDLDSAIKISFVGDLILLRDAVENGYDRATGLYRFDNVFEWMKPYWENDDLTLAVFEGPMAGDRCPYSTSDYDDGILLYLNFPDEFGAAAKHAGVDYVTLANNHLLDQGVDGVMRTLNRLDEIGLNHGGAFRNENEKSVIKILSVRGRRLAVLEYTYGSNYYPDSYFFDKDTSYLTRPIVVLDSKFLKENTRQVRADLAKARSLEVDAIIVMPHMGEQFLHAPDKTQRYWCDEFVRGGADIVLSDHPHSVQPIEWRKGLGNKDVLIVHCPGNYVNSYAPHDGDASYMAELYLDSNSAKPIAAGFVPIYGYGAPEGNFGGIPTYDAFHSDEFMRKLSRNDLRRLQDIQRVVTRVVLGEKVELANAAKRYYLFPSGVKYQQQPEPLDLSIVPYDSPLLRRVKQASHICFVGDSITEDTMNHGVGWYVPMIETLGYVMAEEVLHVFALLGEMATFKIYDKMPDAVANDCKAYLDRLVEDGKLCLPDYDKNGHRWLDDYGMGVQYTGSFDNKAYFKSVEKLVLEAIRKVDEKWQLEDIAQMQSEFGTFPGKFYAAIHDPACRWRNEPVFNHIDVDMFYNAYCSLTNEDKNKVGRLLCARVGRDSLLAENDFWRELIGKLKADVDAFAGTAIPPSVFQKKVFAEQLSKALDGLSVSDVRG